MDRPLCKVCRTKHWPSEDHKFAKGDPAGETLPERSTTDTPTRSDTTREHPGAVLVDAGGPAAPQPGEVCPTCGKRMGLTGAERQRQHRAKARE